MLSSEVTLSRASMQSKFETRIVFWQKCVLYVNVHYLLRELKLYEDNSHEIRIVRHLGTASVVNVIAEYKTKTLTSAESSTFVSYAPTVLYTCPPDPNPPSDDVRFLSNQLDCNLLSNSISGTRFCVGLVMVAAAFLASFGNFFVWIRKIIIFSSNPLP